MNDQEKRVLIARRAALELQNGDVVNLGIGIPTMVADYLRAGVEIFLHTENGMLGVGPTPSQDEIDPNLVNAGKLPVSELPGASYFDSATSFSMIRGGHVDVAIMGALQVDEQGNVANWSVPGQDVLGVGGAMDLAAGARRVIVTATHTTKSGAAKIVKKCTLPVTAFGRADTIITELGVFVFRRGRLTLVELAPGVGLPDVRCRTEADFEVAEPLLPMAI